ncbi:MFS transporter [Marininema halotolerans]|uniref:Sugar phosphate permease n=1 Tax=Marininema halotolerans TaxID=1155944 RepID=A0A1I6TLP0_9BACL|nr:MFS transporter [Marininema halotolerans]SFS90163.1 Sugar phosphate permease [Marininema halotolerans]
MGLATVVQALSTFVTYGVGPLASIWQQKFMLSQTQVGLLISVVNMGPLISMLFIGSALDRYGERWIVGFGSLLIGLTIGLAPLLSSYEALLLLLFFVGINYGTAQPGGSKVVVKWFDPSQRGLAMGIRQAAIPIGGALAGWIIPLISTEYDWSIATLCQAMFAIGGGLVFLAVYRDPDIEGDNNVENYSFIEEITKLLNKKNLYPIIFSGISLITLQMVLVAHLIPFLKSKMEHINLILASEIWSLCLLFGMLGRIALSWLSDKVWKGNRVQPLVLTTFLAVVGVLFLVILPKDSPTWLIFITCSWLGFFGIGWYSLFIVEIAERSNENSVGLTVSYALTLNQIAIIVAPILFGMFVDWKHSFLWAWILIGILLSISGAWLWRINKLSSYEKSNS